MDDKCGNKPIALSFLKHDWFEKVNDKVAVHLYVKEVTECKVEFTEDRTTVFFSTRNSHFIQVHGGVSEKENTEKAKELNFSYLISTREKIIPEDSSFQIKNAFIELVLIKSASKRWASLEIMKSTTNDQHKTLLDCSLVGVKQALPSSLPCTESNAGPNQSDSKDVHKITELLSVSKLSSKTMLNNKSNVSNLSQDTRFSETMQLLGGKSTPVLKKTGEQDQKQDKETTAATDQQSLTSTRDAESKKNVNKAVSFRTETLGLNGLENYANNCYMNVVIQVMANLPEIRDYFLGEHFLNSLSTNNPMSSGGRVAKAFSEVITALWSDSKSVVRPQVLKNIMGKRCSLFMGSQQCDAQEFFVTLLDNLHEDLKQNPRCEKVNENSSKDEDGTPLSEKPDLAWDAHFKRNNSMIVKLFHGQMVSKLTCQSCHKKSITYEPCAQVSLPIPMMKTKLRVLVLFKESTKQPVLTSLQISSPHAQLWHFYNVLEKLVGIPAHCLRALQVSRGSQMAVLNEDSPISIINSAKIVVACEVRDEKEADMISLPFLQHRAQPMRHTNCGQCKKSQSDLEMRLKRCTRCMHIAYCCTECQSKHWPMHQRDCRKGYKAPVGLPFFVTLRKTKLTYEALAAMAANLALFSVTLNKTNDKEIDSTESDPEDRNRLPRQEATTNTLAKTGDNSRRKSSSSEFEQDEKNRPSKSDETCNATAKVTDDDCRPFALSEMDKIDKNRASKVEGATKLVSKTNEQFIIKAFYKTDQEPTLVTAEEFKIDVLSSACYFSIEWQVNNIREKDLKELQTAANTVPGNSLDDANNDSERCTIEDCLSMFMEPDRLLETDCWKCPKCKSVQAVKKEMALSYPPPIVLLHFKRFTFASYGQKVSKAIHYPLSGLDLSNYVTEETKDSLCIPPVYDLTGVICHRGSMGIGHYTCMVQTPGHQGQTDIGWRHFDDDQVTKLPEENVVCSSAYVLIYRMRGIANLLKSECPSPNLCMTGSDVKQDKATATTKSFSRQMSADSSLKDKSKYSGKFDSAASSPRLPMKRSNSTEPVLRRNSPDEAQRQRRIYSEPRPPDHVNEASEPHTDYSAEMYNDVFDDIENAKEAKRVILEDQVEEKVPHIGTEFEKITLGKKLHASIIDESRFRDVTERLPLVNDHVAAMETDLTETNFFEENSTNTGTQSSWMGNEAQAPLQGEININDIDLDLQLSESAFILEQNSIFDADENRKEVLLNVDDITENELD